MFVEIVGFFVGGLPTNYITFLPAVLMVGVFYMLLFRPNQKKQKVWQEMLNNLKIGDKITTTGGMRGTIVALRDDAIQLKLPPDGGATMIVEVPCAPVLIVNDAVSGLTVNASLVIVYAALATALAVNPLAVANALTVAVVETWKAAEYCTDIVVGVEPSVV